jgi:hypothetical protein
MAVVIPIISEWNPKGVQRAMADIQKAGSGFDKFAVGVEKASKTAAIALAGLAYAGFEFAKAAGEDEQAAAVLAKTLQNTTGATKTQIQATEAWITAQGKLLGITDDELRPALGKLVTATGDITKAQELAALAMDISTARGTGLEATSQALAKAYAGNFTALKKLIPGIDEAALKSGDWKTVQDALNKVVGGAAASAADTAAGQYKILTTQMQEVKEEIGAGLLPVMGTLIPLLITMAGFVQENSDAFVAIAGVISAFSAIILVTNFAIKAYAAATALATAATWALNFAMRANPIGIVVTVLAALVTSLILAYKNSEAFRNIIQQVWEWLKIVGNFIKDVIVAYFDLWISRIQKTIQFVTELLNKFNLLDKFKGLFGGSTTLSGTITQSNTTNAQRSSSGSVYVSEEQIARGIGRILQNSDQRNGGSLAFS